MGTTSTTPRPKQTTRRVSFVPRKATQKTPRLSQEEEEEEEEKDEEKEEEGNDVRNDEKQIEETTKRSRFTPRSKPLTKKKESAISISPEDRRLLLRKLFSGRTRG